MREFRIGRHTVSVYDSIEELPMVRFHKYNKMLLIDAGIGSDIASFDAHIEKVVRYMRKGDAENASKELENLRQNVFVVQTEQSPRNLSFACLVAKIDGKACDDISDEGLERTRALLGDVKVKDYATASAEVKKKIDAELTAYFPGQFNSVEEREYYDNMKRLVVTQLEQITDGVTEQGKDRITELQDRLVLAVKPQEFTGREAVGVRHDKQYERMCLALGMNLNVDAKAMTVMEYYVAGEFLNEMMKERQKAASKRR